MMEGAKSAVLAAKDDMANGIKSTSHADTSHRMSATNPK
jgi:hypothetical protein